MAGADRHNEMDTLHESVTSVEMGVDNRPVSPLIMDVESNYKAPQAPTTLDLKQPNNGNEFSMPLNTKMDTSGWFLVI